MQNISYKAKNKANVQKKPRIYFTCHPDDFDRYFDEICERMWQFLRNTPDRVPFTDWYFTTEPYHRGFQARSVQAGLFINLMNL